MNAAVWTKGKRALADVQRLALKVKVTVAVSGCGGLVVSILASGAQVRGFKPGLSRRIFSGEKIHSSKAVCPMLQICGM
jgi:hypothetical protein